MEANGRPGAWFVLQLHAPDAYPAAILIATLRGADYMNFDMGKIYMMITVAQGRAANRHSVPTYGGFAVSPL